MKSHLNKTKEQLPSSINDAFVFNDTGSRYLFFMKDIVENYLFYA